MLYKPSELKAFLADIGAAPKRQLSQNFLIDGNIIRKIVAFADVTEKDTVLEIGPGPGALTEALLATGAQVIAVEKDRKFAQSLRRLQTPDNRLTVFEEDILSWEIRVPKNTKLVGNLPYNIATPILTRFLPRLDLFQSVTIMVQKEVAERLLANPGIKAYSSISIFVQFYSDPIKGFVIEPSCFYPVPKVKSAVVQFILKKPPDVDQDRFFAMIRKAFQQRRKMLRSSLNLAKKFDARPEELSLADFLMLFKEIEEEETHHSS